MNRRTTLRRAAQLTVVLLCALTLKLYYSTASPNQLRWILAPTTALVELVSGTRFVFESHEGYVNSGRTFVIAASCAGVNFLITSFLMLSLRNLWRKRSQDLGWRFIPFSMLFAYVATIIANTVRISIALWLQHLPHGFGSLNPNQLHRVEGVLVYFGFLMLLFMVSEKITSENRGGLLRLSLFPLLLYYATTLAIPLANGAYRQGIGFWEHSLFVFLIPLPIVLLLGVQQRFLRTKVCRAMRSVP